jgi:hypothetical protein
MPVTKYRSVESMPAAAFRPRLDPENLRLACELSSTAVRMVPRCLQSGVYRYRSVADAWEQRQRFETEVRRCGSAGSSDAAANFVCSAAKPR